MRIGIDATSWPNPRGYGRFARNVIGGLVELDRDTEYVLFMDAASANGAQLPSGAELRRVGLERPPSEAAAAGSRRSVADVLRMMRGVRRERLDAFLFPSSYTYFPVPGTPLVLGLHDVTPEDHPELTFPDRRAQLAWRAKQALALREARTVFTVSEASRIALERRFGLSGVAIVPEAPDPVFSPRGPEQVAAALGPLGLRRDGFVMSAGGISPHKNLETLIDAYALVRQSRPDAPPLVLVGDMEGPYMSAAASVRARIAGHGLQDHVLLPGFVTDEQLACLYAGTAALVLPSLSEGFGLPAVEAAACGAPELLSDLPAHRETLGDSALYFRPSDAAGLAGLLDPLLGEAGRRADLGRRAREAVAHLSWEHSAERMREILAGAVRGS